MMLQVRKLIFKFYDIYYALITFVNKEQKPNI